MMNIVKNTYGKRICAGWDGNGSKQAYNLDGELKENLSD